MNKRELRTRALTVAGYSRLPVDAISKSGVDALIARQVNAARVVVGRSGDGSIFTTKTYGLVSNQRVYEDAAIYADQWLFVAYVSIKTSVSQTEFTLLRGLSRVEFDRAVSSVDAFSKPVANDPIWCIPGPAIVDGVDTPRWIGKLEIAPAPAATVADGLRVVGVAWMDIATDDTEIPLPEITLDEVIKVVAGQISLATGKGAPE